MDMNLGYLISYQISLIAQHDTSKLVFPALITTLCKARGVQLDSRSLESLSPAINFTYIKKNCWNLDDPTVTFRGPRKARGGGRASAAQEPAFEELAAVVAEGEDELTPPKPSYFDAGIHMAQEEDASTD
ncbi:hypothetical protein HKD37_08G022944 [Glycine soja]